MWGGNGGGYIIKLLEWAQDNSLTFCHCQDFVKLKKKGWKNLEENEKILKNLKPKDIQN